MKSTDTLLLLNWYSENRRDLPWRQTKDPYAIWISETMLQQTTSRAVIPYFAKFLQRFPTVQSLAQAELPDVLAQWAGLGYYSRAKNLHLAAQRIQQLGDFPKNYQDLLLLPGFGPYTSRAVSSLAFSQSVGVLDGNVIRVLSRKFNLKTQWWKRLERQELQNKSDEMVKYGPSADVNQALMELGSQICTPQNPHCILCPWMKSCMARKQKSIQEIPLKKPKRPTEIWQWWAEVHVTKDFHIRLVKNTQVPFLRDYWFLPGKAQKISQKPKNYDFGHSITHHDICVQLKLKKATIKNSQLKIQTKSEMWVHVNDLHRHAPASLVKKAVTHALEKRK